MVLIIRYYIDQVDAESSKEIEQWNEMLKTDAVKLCQDNNFNTGFFEGSDNNSVVDAYELKVYMVTLIFFSFLSTKLVFDFVIQLFYYLFLLI